MNRTLFSLGAAIALFGCAPNAPAPPPSAAYAWRPKPPLIAPVTEKRRKKPAQPIAPATVTQAPPASEPTSTSADVPPAPTQPAAEVAAPSPAETVAQDYVRAAEFLHQYRARLPCAGPDTGPPLLCKDPEVEERLQNAVTDAAPPVVRATTQRGDETEVKAAADVAAAAVQPLNEIVVPLAK